MPALIILALSPVAQAATYDSQFWLVNASLGYDVVNPSDLNDPLGGIAAIQGLVSGRLKLERGLRAPDVSHWIELGYHTVSTEGSDPPLLQLGAQQFRYLSILPLGASFWFKRTAYIDFGAGGGAGIALSPRWQLTRTNQAGTTTVTEATGGASLVAEARAVGRFWMGRYTALDLAAAFRYGAPSVGGTKANLIGFSLLAGASFALGGVRGTGKTWVEVIKAPRKE